MSVIPFESWPSVDRVIFNELLKRVAGKVTHPAVRGRNLQMLPLVPPWTSLIDAYLKYPLGDSNPDRGYIIFREVLKAAVSEGDMAYVNAVVDAADRRGDLVGVVTHMVTTLENAVKAADAEAIKRSSCDGEPGWGSMYAKLIWPEIMKLIPRKVTSPYLWGLDFVNLKSGPVFDALKAAYIKFDSGGGDPRYHLFKGMMTVQIRYGSEASVCLALRAGVNRGALVWIVRDMAAAADAAARPNVVDRPKPIHEVLNEAVDSGSQMLLLCSEAYLRLLSLGEWRGRGTRRGQDLLCGLRNVISRMTKIDAEKVQDDYAAEAIKLRESEEATKGATP